MKKKEEIEGEKKEPEKKTLFSFGNPNSIFGGGGGTGGFSLNAGSNTNMGFNLNSFSSSGFGTGSTNQFSGLFKTSEKNENDAEGEATVEPDNVGFTGKERPNFEKPKDPVTTGEEEEEAIFEAQKARLYKFLNGNWTPHASGSIKINKNRTNEKSRLIFRKEGGLLLGMNASIYTGMKGTKQGEKSVVFTAQNATDEDTALSTYSIRFFSALDADKFLNLLNDCGKK